MTWEQYIKRVDKLKKEYKKIKKKRAKADKAYIKELAEAENIIDY